MSPWGRITNQLKNWAPLGGPKSVAGARRVEAKASAVGKLLKGPWETAWVPLCGPSWTGRTFEQLTREGYRKNAVAHRAVKIIAESAASVPITLFRGDERLNRHPLLDLLARPNPIQSGAELRESLYAFLQLAGNAYLEAAETLSGAPAEIYVLRPDRIKVVPGVRGWPERYEYRVGPRVHNFPVDANSGASPILHLRLFNPLDDWLGMSPLEAAAHGIEIGHALARRKLPGSYNDFIAQEYTDGAGKHHASGLAWFANLSVRSEASAKEAFAEAFAWFTSPSYPHDGVPGVGDPPRLPLEIEKAILDMLQDRPRK